MLIDLPPLQHYSIADCQDLFISKMDDDCEIDGSGQSKCDERLGAPQAYGVLSDTEPFYTSSSESDTDVCFSDIEISIRVLAGDKSQLGSHSVMSFPGKKSERELALHSPGQLLGTPRDSSRRYEYPFPAHLRMGDSDITDDDASSTATTPGLTPAEGSSLGLVAFSASGGIASGSASLPVYPQAHAPVPIPVATASTNTAAAKASSAPLAPLSHVSPVQGPSSAPALSTSTVAAHPKLSRFNPANAPVPPGLRGRKQKSASISVPQPDTNGVQSMSVSISARSVTALPVGSS